MFVVFVISIMSQSLLVVAIWGILLTSGVNQPVWICTSCALPAIAATSHWNQVFCDDFIQYQGLPKGKKSGGNGVFFHRKLLNFEVRNASHAFSSARHSAGARDTISGCHHGWCGCASSNVGYKNGWFIKTHWCNKQWLQCPIFLCNAHINTVVKFRCPFQASEGLIHVALV